MKKIISKKSNFLFLLSLFVINSFGQTKPLVVFDLVEGTLDSITNIAYDTTIGFEKTPYFIGNFDSNIETLEQTPPTENVFPNSQFSLKRKVFSDFDINSYPLRTSIKMFHEKDGILDNQCSGSLISKRHVLTAAHCIVTIGTNDIISDSIYICPIFSNGKFSSNFDCSYVTKIYFFKDWKLNGEDIAVLELADPIGESTGWISMGFDETDNQFSDDIFYKFSYPGIMLPFDPIDYNGDTLYYNYGKIDIINGGYMGVSNSYGIPGESGSSFISVKNNESYTSYGVLTYGGQLMHTRLRNKFFYPFKSIIDEDTVLGSLHPSLTLNPIVYPNPTNEQIYIKNIPSNIALKFSIYDLLGRIVISETNHNTSDAIDISQLPNGNYYLKIISESLICFKQIIKAGR